MHIPNVFLNKPLKGHWHSGNAPWHSLKLVKPERTDKCSLPLALFSHGYLIVAPPKVQCWEPFACLKDSPRHCQYEGLCTGLVWCDYWQCNSRLFHFFLRATIGEVYKSWDSLRMRAACSCCKCHHTSSVLAGAKRWDLSLLGGIFGEIFPNLNMHILRCLESN